MGDIGQLFISICPMTNILALSSNLKIQVDTEISCGNDARGVFRNVTNSMTRGLAAKIDLQIETLPPCAGSEVLF